MKKSLYLIIYIMVVHLGSLNINAQDNSTLRQIYSQAESDYQLGRLEQAIDLLQTHQNNFQGNMRQNVYRLISLCYLAQDSLQQSEIYASLLLKENPYYTSVQDPIRFEEMVNRLKTGSSATVTTASSQAERIEEAPVPVIIITREMIETLGYNKSLNQLLATYVPGMAEVASNYMDNMAMHGAYTSNQEKILVMENGHRLNTRSTNSGRMDYSISTDKIDHIEVLRGPASSLYGNVALSAVVNIITRSGRSIDGVEAKYGYGSFGTHKGDFMIGTSYMNTDIFAWASIYKSNGQQRRMSDGLGYEEQCFAAYSTDQEYDNSGIAHIATYKDTPAYDIGLTLKNGDFFLGFSRKNSKKASQYAYYSNYDYDLYRDFDGIKPGYNIEDMHAELGYSHQFRNIGLSATFYGDWYNFTDYSVIAEHIYYPDFNNDGTVKLNEDGVPVIKLWDGFYQVYNWKEHTLGGNVKASTDYKTGDMKGNLLVGCQYEYFTLSDTYGMLGADYDSTAIFTRASKNTIRVGHETGLSFYAQDKHYFSSRLILNAGLRYDVKFRANDTKVSALSPRLALIYIPNSLFSMKISYSKAFVDAPYFYRFNSDNTYRGLENLQPEYLNSVQFDVLGKIESWHLNYDLNIFYNRFKNLIYLDPTAGLEDQKYLNSGRLENTGIEVCASYLYKRLSGNLSFYYCKDLKAQDYYFSQDEKQVYSVPSITANLHLGWKPMITSKHEVQLYGNLQYIGRKLMVSPTFDDFYIADRTLLDVGISYKFMNRVKLSFDVENIFNTDSYVCGPTVLVFPYFQRGRTLMGSISFSL
ncbi:MAG: TonB-dependent receptor [Prevotella sp.]|nr:TonB-dependent receptor [Prevotella sp.]